MQTTTAESNSKPKKKNQTQTFESDEALKEAVFLLLMRNTKIALNLSVDVDSKVWVLKSKVIME